MILNTAMFNDNGQSGYILKVIFVNKILLKFSNGLYLSRENIALAKAPGFNTH